MKFLMGTEKKTEINTKNKNFYKYTLTGQKNRCKLCPSSKAKALWLRP
jgi:hypothetical protein